MKHTTFILVLLMAALLVTPVAAVTYSDEYYKLGNLSDIPMDNFLHRDVGKITTLDAGGIAAIGSYFELRRQTILMEKQNELLEEQNGLMREQMGMKLQCTDSTVGVCREYSRVTK